MVIIDAHPMFIPRLYVIILLDLQEVRVVEQPINVKLLGHLTIGCLNNLMSSVKGMMSFARELFFLIMTRQDGETNSVLLQ